MKYSGVGGQAVMEGVMMRNGDKYAVAVRKPDHEIEVKIENYKGPGSASLLRKLPIVRGVISFVDSLYLGMSTLMFSASFFEEEEEDKKKNEKKDANYPSSWHSPSFLYCLIFCPVCSGHLSNRSFCSLFWRA